MRKISSIATAIIGLAIGFGGAVAVAAISGPAYIDADTDQLFPAQVPPTRVQYPNGAVKTQYATGTNTVTQTDLATVTPSVSAIPMAGTDSKIDNGWINTGTGTTHIITGADPRLTDGRTSTDTLYCSGCQLSGTGTGTATSMAISQNPEIIVTPASVGALPASSVSGTQNYLAKFGATGATLENSRIYEPGTSGRVDILINASSTVSPIDNLADLSGAFLGIHPGAAYDVVDSSAGIVSRTDVIDGIARGAIIWRRFGATWDTALDFYIHPSGTADVNEIMRALALTQAEATFLGNVSTPSLILRGSTSGSAAITVPAVAGTTTWRLPAANCTTSQSLNFSDASGTMACYTPMVADGTTGTGCTTISSTAGKVTACDTTARVPTSRSVTCGGGLSQSGGPALTSDVTCAIAAADSSITVNADSISVNVISDTQHGTRGGGTLHAVATTSTAGFESAADKTKLDGIATGATNTPLSSSTPNAEYSGASGYAGVSTYASRYDHVHSMPALVSVSSATPAAEAPGSTGSAGTSADASRADHVHAFTAYATIVPRGGDRSVPSVGTSAYLARGDHVHAAPIDLSWSNGARAGGLQGMIAITCAWTEVLEFPVVWPNSPTTLYPWMGMATINGSVANNNVEVQVNTGSYVPRTQGPTTIISSTFGYGTALRSMLSRALGTSFTKPSGNDMENVSLVQIYMRTSDCAGASLDSFHLRIIPE